MKKLIVAICMLGCLVSCGVGKKNPDVQESQGELTDSVEVVADTLVVEEVVEEPEVSAYAERSFADFLYNFATSERFQLRRVIFPLPYYMDSKKDSIEKEEWKHDPLFSQQEFYTMLYDELEDAELEKDTASTSVRIGDIHHQGSDTAQQLTHQRPTADAERQGACNRDTSS